MKYNTQKQAQQTAINKIKAFEKELNILYSETPKGDIKETLWNIYIIQLRLKCKETIANIKGNIKHNNENNK